MNAGESSRSAPALPAIAAAGGVMFPVPRTMLASVLKSQDVIAPAKMICEYVSAISSASPRPPRAA
jgi:hypothetical protein